MEKTFIRLIDSTQAGIARRARLQELRSKMGPLPDFVGELDFCTCQQAGDVDRFTRAWAERYGSAGLIYVLGGDGSFSEACHAVATCLSDPPALGVIPFGTGNDFARLLYGPLTGKKWLTQFAKGLFVPERKWIDLIQVNDIVGVNLFSFGVDTEILRLAMQFKKAHPKLHSLSYPAGVAQYLTRHHFRLEKQSVRICSKRGSEVLLDSTLDLVLGVVGNGQYYGGGFRPCPQAHLDDGALDLVLIQAMSGLPMLQALIRYRKGAHLSLPEVADYKISELELERLDGQPFIANLDGNIMKEAQYHIKRTEQRLWLALPTKGLL